MSVYHNDPSKPLFRTLRKFRAIGQGGEADYVKRLQDPMLTISLCIRIALLLAAVLLMNAKPELWESLGIVGGAVVLGLLVALIFPSRESRLRIPAADSGGLC